jgi:hypothetical protein
MTASVYDKSCPGERQLLMYNTELQCLPSHLAVLRLDGSDQMVVYSSLSFNLVAILAPFVEHVVYILAQRQSRWIFEIVCSNSPLAMSHLV